MINPEEISKEIQRLWVGLIVGMVGTITLMYLLGREGVTQSDALLMEMRWEKEMELFKRDLLNALGDEAQSDNMFHESMARLHAADQESLTMLREIHVMCIAQWGGNQRHDGNGG